MRGSRCVRKGLGVSRCRCCGGECWGGGASVVVVVVKNRVSHGGDVEGECEGGAGEKVSSRGDVGLRYFDFLTTSLFPPSPPRARSPLQERP